MGTSALLRYLSLYFAFAGKAHQTNSDDIMGEGKYVIASQNNDNSCTHFTLPYLRSYYSTIIILGSILPNNKRIENAF